MIGFLRGTLFSKEPSELLVLIDVNGIGYEVHIPSSCFSNLSGIGTEIFLYIHLVSRDDGDSLYGFNNREQQSLFRTLIKINGIGPKLALMILSSMEPSIFVSYLNEGDAKALEKIPGIGIKMAQRLVIELKDKLDNWNSIDQTFLQTTALNDALGALISLGYKRHEAQRALENHRDKNLSSEELIRLALKKTK